LDLSCTESVSVDTTPTTRKPEGSSTKAGPPLIPAAVGDTALLCGFGTNVPSLYT
jgi:hypothetical protein